MGTRNKGKWSWGTAFGRATGNIIGTSISGAIVGSLYGGPPGGVAGAAIGAAGSFVNGFMGYALGYWWDEPPVMVEEFWSGVLYTTVVSGSFMLLLYLIVMGRLVSQPDAVERAFIAIPTGVGFFGSLSRSLLDDLRAAARDRMLP